jgi:hypothetical protein
MLINQNCFSNFCFRSLFGFILTTGFSYREPKGCSFTIRGSTPGFLKNGGTLMKWKRKRSLTVINYPDFRVGAARTLHWKYHKIRRCLFPSNFPQYMFVIGPYAGFSPISRNFSYTEYCKFYMLFIAL